MSRYLIANIEVKQAEIDRFAETVAVMRETVNFADDLVYPAPA